MTESPETSVSPASAGTGQRCIGLHPDDPRERCPERAAWEVMTTCAYGHEKAGPACSKHKLALEQGLADDGFDHPLTLVYATPV